MDAIVHECGVINDVFESLSINKSLVVINDLRCTYHIDTILKHQLFPVEKLVYVNFNETLERFVTGTLRMMIMSEAMFRVFRLNYVYDNKETRFSYQNDGDYFHKNITYYMKGIVVRRVKKPTTTSQKMKYSITYPSGTRFAGSAAERSTKSLIEKIVRWQETVNPIENDKDIR